MSGKLAFMKLLAGRLRSPRIRISRGTPLRRPYSTQQKFPISGEASLPCVDWKIDRGMGSLNGQVSRLMTIWTISRFPFGAASLGRAVESMNGTRGLERNDIA